MLWLAGADLRLTVLAVPPVLPLIHRQFALSERAVGALSGLPVLLFGLAAIPGSLLIARLGARGAAIVGLLLVAAASAARGIGPSAPLLFAMTFLMAAGVAVVQPALPALVAEWFADRPGFATAVYANGLADRRGVAGGADDPAGPAAGRRQLAGELCLLVGPGRGDGAGDGAVRERTRRDRRTRRRRAGGPIGAAAKPGSSA